MKILVLNGGSSSFKCSLYDLPAAATPLPIQPRPPAWEARVDWSHHSGSAEIRIRGSAGERTTRLPAAAPAALLRPALESLWTGSLRIGDSPGVIEAAGHRIVHGGPLRDSALLTGEVRADIARQVEFAPAHNRFELEAIAEVDSLFGAGIPQVAVFDTAFHATLTPAAYTYPGPYEWLSNGIRRYGFHGINHQYVAARAAQMLDRDPSSLRLITCHLGNGCSLCAVKGGQSVDTTMGFTPLEGLMMGTRSGSVDPAILIYLLRHRGVTADELDRVLNQESGLKGVSGVSADMREILAAIAQGNSRAQLAFDVYAHRLIREIGGMAAVLGGVDALVFTGGVGENCPPLREAACRQLAFVGIQVDPGRNRAPGGQDCDIAAPQSRARVLIVHAQEDWQIARECRRLAAQGL